uniref:Nuclear pore complex protein Nup88 n=1 Tax=Haemonchus contortus TaxID=6289 RepID=A0A7I4Y4Y3_HAECO|nr:Protein ZK177.4 [Haemonchus contortus]
MRTSLSELRKSLLGKPYLISSFRYKNLVIFCDGSMTFVYGLNNNNGVAEYTRSVKVLLSPSLPDDVEITSMSVMHDGSLAVLSSANCLFITRVSTDLWISKADGNVPYNQYICEVQEVHPTLFDSPRPPKVLRLRWIVMDSLNSSVHLLAVLFSDNRIRIYQADNICDIPFATIDYASFMCASDRTCDGYGSNSYGFFKSIVSFDCIVEPDEAPVVIAIDSEGEMYSTVININNSSPALTRPLIPPSNLPCDPVDLRLVDHPMSDLFSVFAVLSASNAICFVVAVPDEHASFSLFLHEQLQLPQSSSWSLCTDSFESTILVANESTVYHMDLSSWLQDYADALGESGTGTRPASTLKGTVTRELISTLYHHEKTELPHSLCPAQERAVGLLCKSTNPRASTVMFIACTQDPPLATAFLKQTVTDPQIHDSESVVPKDMRLNVNEKVLNTILSKRKALTPLLKAPSYQEQLKNLADFFDCAHKNQIVLRAALEMSQDRLNVLVSFAAQLAERQSILNQRLLQVFRQNVNLREKNEQLRTDVSKTLSRVDKLSVRLTENQKLSAEELKLLARLKECRAKMLSNSVKVSKLSIEAAQLERETRGTARPFTASMGANLFILEHGKEELTALKSRLENLCVKFAELLSHDLTENKENMGV